eukprot:UN05624
MNLFQVNVIFIGYLILFLQHFGVVLLYCLFIKQHQFGLVHYKFGCFHHHLLFYRLQHILKDNYGIHIMQNVAYKYIQARKQQQSK